MTINSATPSLAGADARQCLDARADGFNLLTIGFNDCPHQFEKLFIINCVNSNKNKNKKQRNEDNGNLPKQIQTATINFIGEQCPKFHQVPTLSLCSVVASILMAGT